MSESPKKLFISYSSKDRAEVSKLISALKNQKIDAWDYSRPGQDLPLARKVKDSLREEIDSREYFIAVISPNSLDRQTGQYPRFEVRYAIESGKLERYQFLPIFINAPGKKSWCRLYPEIKEFKYVEVDFSNEKKLENLTREICEWTVADYTPSPLLDNLIFFAQKFREEFKKFLLSNKEQNTPLSPDEVTHLSGLMIECAEFTIAGEKAKMQEKRKKLWEKAAKSASNFHDELKKIRPDTQFYYPIIIKGALELKLEQYENAEKTYLEATTDPASLNNSLFWLGYAGLGHVYLSLERYDDSILAFEQALAFGEADDADIRDEDFDVIKIFLLSAVLKSETDDLSEGILNKYDFEAILNKFDRSQLSPEENLDFFRLQGEFYYKTGNFAFAAKAFQKLGKDNLDKNSAIYYSLALSGTGKDSKAVVILEDSARKLKSAELYYFLSVFYFQVRDIEKGLKVYEDVLCNPDPDYRNFWSREHFICYALAMKAIDKDKYIEKIHAICEKVLDPKFFSFPVTGDEYYYNGFANYLLGRFARAEYDFERSGQSYDNYYDKLNL